MIYLINDETPFPSPETASEEGIVAFLIDAHIGQLVGSFFPHFHLASHFLFLFLLFETIEVSEYLYLAYCCIVGLVYDIYFSL